MYITTLKTKGQKKDFINFFLFAKSINLNGNLKKLHAKMCHSSFIKLKTALRAARKWGPSFEVSLRTIFKKCKVCTHHRVIIDMNVTHFNEMQVEIHKDADLNTGYCILMTDLFHVRYNRHRHRLLDGNQQLCYTLGSGPIW